MFTHIAMVGANFLLFRHFVGGAFWSVGLALSNIVVMVVSNYNICKIGTFYIANVMPERLGTFWRYDSNS